MRSYRTNSHSKHDLKVHLVWIPKYRKRILTGKVAERVRDVLRQISMDHEVYLISGKVVADHIHMFVSYKPQIALSKLVQYLKGGSARIMFEEFPHLKKQFWGRHLWARGYMAVSSGIGLWTKSSKIFTNILLNSKIKSDYLSTNKYLNI